MRFRTIFDESPDAYLIIDIDHGKILECNKATEEILGTVKDNILHSTPVQFSPKYQADGSLSKDLARLQISESLKFGKNRFEWIHKKYDGTEFWADVSISVMDYDQQKVLLVSWRDIDEAKKAKEALKESEERWKFAIDGSGDGLWDWDAQTNKVFFSSQWKRMFGYEDDEITDSFEEWKQRVHPDDWQSCLDDLNKHFVGDTKNYSNVHRMLCKDGTYKWILDRGLVLEWLEDGKPKRVIGTHRDISAEKATEQEIKKLLDEISLANHALAASLEQKNALIDSLEETKNKLEESNYEKDKFFSIIAHDLRSPFNGFIGLTKVMVEDIEDLSLREFHEFSKALHDSAENLYKLLENLLTWSSEKRGSTSFRPEPFLLKESVDIAYNLQKASLENKEQKVEIEVSPDIYVFGDTQMVNTVIRNLLSNANKFTRKGGLIKITAREIDNEIEISIADSGIGIPEDILKNLFKLGEKTSRKGTDYESSSGLGLLLCKEFVEKNNGRIWVESTEDIGTTFYFTLPRFDISI